MNKTRNRNNTNRSARKRHTYRNRGGADKKKKNGNGKEDYVRLEYKPSTLPKFFERSLGVTGQTLDNTINKLYGMNTDAEIEGFVFPKYIPRDNDYTFSFYRSAINPSNYGKMIVTKTESYPNGFVDNLLGSTMDVEEFFAFMKRPYKYVIMNEHLYKTGSQADKDQLKSMKEYNEQIDLLEKPFYKRKIKNREFMDTFV